MSSPTAISQMQSRISRDCLDLPTVQHHPDLPVALQHQGCSYVIAWEQRGDVIVAAETRGSHDFLSASKKFVFQLGEGYVGRIMMTASAEQSDCELLPDISNADVRQFIRKQAALISGISSILFVRKGHQLVELGYEDLSGGKWSLPLLKLNHRLAAEQFQSPIWLAVSAEYDYLDLRMTGMSLSKSMWEGGEPTVAMIKLTNRDLAFNSSIEDSKWKCSVAEDITAPSAGSEGHPTSCKLPCKYFWKAKGCLDGEKCLRCHLCPFTRSSCKRGRLQDECDTPKSTKSSANEATISLSQLLAAHDDATRHFPMADMPDGYDNAQTSIASMGRASSKASFEESHAALPGLPSLGSMGHPHSCNQPCKYVWKSQGCYNGASCERCHLCIYSRSLDRCGTKAKEICHGSRR